MAVNPFLIISSAICNFKYDERLIIRSPDERLERVRLFLIREYVFQATADGKYDYPLNQVIGNSTKLRILCTNGSTTRIRYPNLDVWGDINRSVRGTPEEDKDYTVNSVGGEYKIASQVHMFNPENNRWTTGIEISGQWNYGKRIPLVSNLRENWEA